ncbi:hypothetical protein FKM82_024042 [Ascaphus truei]
MKATKCSLVSGFLCRLRRSEASLDIAWSLLFGRRLLGERKGSGATQLPNLSLKSSLSINLKNSLSSIDGACLSSSFVVWNTVIPRSLGYFLATGASP